MIKYEYMVYPAGYVESLGEPNQLKFTKHKSLKTATKKAKSLGLGAEIMRNRYPLLT